MGCPYHPTAIPSPWPLTLLSRARRRRNDAHAQALPSKKEPLPYYLSEGLLRPRNSNTDFIAIRTDRVG